MGYWVEQAETDLKDYGSLGTPDRHGQNRSPGSVTNARNSESVGD